MEPFLSTTILLAYFALRGGLVALCSCGPANLRKLLRNRVQALRAPEAEDIPAGKANLGDISPLIEHMPVPVTVTEAEVEQTATLVEVGPEKVVTKQDLEITEPIETETYDGDAEGNEEEQKNVPVPTKHKVEESDGPAEEEIEPVQIETPDEEVEVAEEEEAAESSDESVSEPNEMPPEVKADEQHTEEAQAQHENNAVSCVIRQPIIPGFHPSTMAHANVTPACEIVRPKMPWEK